MQFVKLTQQLALITTAATLLAGPAAAHAEGRRPLGSGGAGLTGQTPAAWVQAPAPVVPTGTVPVSPASPPPVPPTPPDSVPAPSTPPATPISPASGAIPPANPAPAPAPATPAPPTASNGTTQTISQVQVSTCVSHCDGGNQVQQASQDNTTVQAVGPPAPRDGGASIVATPLPTVRTTASAPPDSSPASATPATTPTPPASGVSQLQVGCLEHCYGATTLDTSGMTLAQIEQLLSELQLPTPPVAATAPAGVQNSTQQTATQSENGEGDQAQVAGQTNGTTQVVVTPAGAPADGGAGAETADGGTPAAVNQTAQGIVQLQVGCIFYCSGTQQTQEAQQSNATVQTVDSGGAGAVNTVSQGVAQVQVGCVAWCYDAVESQTATGSDATVVAVAAPPPVTPSGAAAPVATTPVAPASPVPAHGPSPSPRSTGARSRDSGGAPVRAPAVVFGGGMSGTAFVPVAAPATLPTEASRNASHRSHRRHHLARHRRALPPFHSAPLALAGTGPVAVAGTSTAQPSMELAALLMLAGLGVGAWRWRLVR